MRRVDLYVPRATVDVARESVATLTGNAVDRQSFQRQRSLGGVAYYGESMVFTDAQYTVFKNLAIAGGRWYAGDSRQRVHERVLQETNTDANGSVWTIDDTEADVAANPQTDWQNERIWWNGWTTRETATAGSNPPDIPLPGFDIYTPNVKFINCIIHDLSGLGFWIDAVDAEFYGCIIYNIGWLGPDRGHGHGLYTQNQSGSTKLVKDCIIHDNFGWGIHAYSSSGDNLREFTFQGNTCFRNGSLTGGARPDMLLGGDSVAAGPATFDANMTYGGSIGLQFYGAGAENITLTDNYCPNDKSANYTATTETGNHWGPAVGNQVFVRPNDYEAGRANITIYNEAQADSVQVDVTGVLLPDADYQLRNSQDYFGDIAIGTVAQDGTITVDMRASSHSVAAPVAWTAPETTLPEFGCFVLQAA